MTFISTLIGIIGAIALFFYAITSNTDNFIIFISPTSVAMVLGGTAAATIISYNMKEFVTAIFALFRTFSEERDNHSTLRSDIKRFIEWSQIYRQQGLTAVSNSLTNKEKKNEFLTYCLEQITAGYDSKEIRYLISNRIEADFSRRTQSAKVLHTMASYSPAFGMVGTIIGLIIMLDNMDGDITALGKGLALALITTLYGVMLAQLIFRPAAVHIFKKMEGEYLRHQLWCDGFVFMMEKADALTIQDRLNALINPKAYYDMASEQS